MVAVPMRRTAEELDNEVAARMYRQHRLSSAENPLELVAVVDEGALHRTVGGPEVMRERSSSPVSGRASSTVPRALPLLASSSTCALKPRPT
jgi:Domain of unknown function (DUF5753)